MIVYVHFEHKRLQQDPILWRFFATRTLETKYRLEAISGEQCLIIHYEGLSPALLHELNPRAVVVSGNYTGFQHFVEEELAGMRTLFREAARPTLCMCGSFQLMAETYGAAIGPIDLFSSGTPDSYPDTDTPLPPGLTDSSPDPPGYDRRHERGFMPVRVLHPHPLFNGLDRRPVFFQLHGGEVKSVPDGFQLLAESDLCSVQAIAHSHAPLFGTQFHPELYDKTHPDGQRILENFFKIAMQHTVSV